MGYALPEEEHQPFSKNFISLGSQQLEEGINRRCAMPDDPEKTSAWWAQADLVPTTTIEGEPATGNVPEQNSGVWNRGLFRKIFKRRY